MLEFQRRELQFKLDGNEYGLKFPNVEQMSKYSMDYEKAEDKLGSIVSFLELLGLDSKVSRSMELSHLTTIIKELTAEKK